MTARSALTVLFLLAVGSFACAPPTLPAGSQDSADSDGTSSKKHKTTKTTSGDDDDDSTSGDDDDSTSGDDDDSTGSTGTKSTGSTKAPPAEFSAVFDSLKPTCGTCHSSAPKFFGSDAASSYSLMKPEEGKLATKGAHSGPDTTDDQKSLIQAWQAADP